MNRLCLQKFLDDAEAQRAELFIYESSEQPFLELFIDLQPLGIFLNEIALLGHSRKQDLQMRFTEALYSFLPY